MNHCGVFNELPSGPGCGGSPGGQGPDFLAGRMTIGPSRGRICSPGLEVSVEKSKAGGNH